MKSLNWSGAAQLQLREILAEPSSGSETAK